MAKGIIVVEIPEQCDVCIAYYQGLRHDICGITEEKVDWDEKPDWCPIKPTPEKIQYVTRQAFSKEQFAAGWNACIEEMLGE
jgi:hypothetical protein